MLVEVCRVRVAKHDKFGRILELTERVSAGQDIVVERPVIEVDVPTLSGTDGKGVADGPYFKGAYAVLSDEQKAFLSNLDSNPEVADHPIAQHLSPEEDHFRRVLEVNAHSYSSGKQQALFEHITIAPHACDPNAGYCSVSAMGFGRLFALRDLEPGEHVTITYIASPGSLRLWPRWQRQAFLQMKFHFMCCCSMCEAGKDANPPPSAASLQLLKAYDVLDNAFTHQEHFLTLADRLLEKCAAASPSDDAQFHMFRVHDLCHEFHINHFLQAPTGGEDHLLPALACLAQRYALIPADESPLLDFGSLSFVFTAGSRFIAKLKESDSEEARWLHALCRLWYQLGSVVRDSWGSYDPDYLSLCEVFGSPREQLPCISGIVRELQSVGPCMVCGAASVLKCSRCSKVIYCSSDCQRVHWPGHKMFCQAVLNSPKI
eukprot:gnl/TRDRNA2_/TRDRNA2_125855_c0_seq2.p1 gnl/TRDRNA2_/TRDRNA2_125855_c0~~gnl/TRDRNA2_/TRDRNA2_125855_c0_seq2.p1  ORF type:complete len:432 (-),score=61.01 gnl/TRDRNA2_/TRDRNA2_125855_c0_seq2:15-1310(-)